MRRNGYLCTSGVNLDTAVRFADPDFLLEWSRKYTTRVDPHVDNFHKVWSWYNHTLPSYSDLSADISRDFVTLTFEQLLCMASDVTNLATKLEDPTPIHSWVMSYRSVSRWLPLKMRTLLLRMRRITWPASRESKTITFWNPRSWFVYPLCTSVAVRWM